MDAYPDALTVCTYDLRGTVVGDDRPRVNRESGLVTRTHHLLRALAQRHPALRLSITTTGATAPGAVYDLRTPEGQTVQVHEIATAFPDLLQEAGRKSDVHVRHYYEDAIDDPANPVYRSLATQYADAVHTAGTSHVLAMSINPLIALLKAREFGLIDQSVRIAAVVNDGGREFVRRFGYLAERVAGGAETGLSLIAVSEASRQELILSGVPADAVSTVHNGMDTAAFIGRVQQVQAAGVWERVRDRNQVPADRKVVLMCARRVKWKGHLDLIWAARHLADRGGLDDAVVVCNGAGMLDSRFPGYQYELEALIGALGLDDRVFLLDELTPLEVVACYAGADVAVLPSQRPEPFGYANIEAMLAAVPVIATGHGGPLAYIEHGESGLLVPPESPAALADALHRLLVDDAGRDRMGQAARRSAVRFGLDAMLDGYEAALAAAGRVPEGAR